MRYTVAFDHRLHTSKYKGLKCIDTAIKDPPTPRSSCQQTLRARFPPLDPTQPQAVVDLRVRRSSSSSSSSISSDSSGPEDSIDDANDGASHNINASSASDATAPESQSAKANSQQHQKVCQRFGPDEDYLLAVQVNVDVPYTAKHGDVDKLWQTVADKLNMSPNFNMKKIKGATAKARFKSLLAKHRAWETESAKKSGTDEPETPFITLMTEITTRVNDHEAGVTGSAETKEAEKRAKEKSGEVVRQAAVDRIKLGKRRSLSDDDDADAKDEVSTCVNPNERPAG
ncbi:hypothetical protein PR003_g12309 [Phytophthora rubi]|uniref:Myb-like domain-containing protein n=2 Tax=Phytophthora rubi TaxID=129364 RepID=A0A6A3L3I3_9STRA|nr:hypothetical protein PR001_g15210 [Phytophthora rubi]KAE9336837.1 hypothetical protein PR003_g12309 [Phytophthora rubi]